MRYRWGLLPAVCVALVVAVPARADDQADMRKLVDQAIKAMGGEETLAKNKAVTMKFKGKVRINGMDVEYTAEWATQYPDQEKISVSSNDFSIEFVVNKDKGWVKENGTTREMRKEELAEQKAMMYARSVAGLVVLKGKGFKLSPVGEVKVGKHDAMGVKVSHKGRPDVNLYFDTKTHLLVKSETTAKNPETGKEVNQETFYQDYKKADGQKYPSKMKIKRDGQQYVDIDEVTEYKPEEKLDDSVFDKP
jgi:hypothetical protein